MRRPPQTPTLYAAPTGTEAKATPTSISTLPCYGQTETPEYSEYDVALADASNMYTVPPTPHEAWPASYATQPAQAAAQLQPRYEQLELEPAGLTEETTDEANAPIHLYLDLEKVEHYTQPLAVVHKKMCDTLGAQEKVQLKNLLSRRAQQQALAAQEQHTLIRLLRSIGFRIMDKRQANTQDAVICATTEDYIELEDFTNHAPITPEDLEYLAIDQILTANNPQATIAATTQKSTDPNFILTTDKNLTPTQKNRLTELLFLLAHDTPQPVEAPSPIVALSTQTKMVIGAVAAIAVVDLALAIAALLKPMNTEFNAAGLQSQLQSLNNSMQQFMQSSMAQLANLAAQQRSQETQIKSLNETAIAELQQQISTQELALTNNATALTKLMTLVLQQGAALAANASMLTELTTLVTAQGIALASNATALTMLDSIVNGIETMLATLSSQLTSLNITQIAQATMLTLFNNTVVGFTNAANVLTTSVASLNNAFAGNITVVKNAITQNAQAAAWSAANATLAAGNATLAASSKTAAANSATAAANSKTAAASSATAAASSASSASSSVTAAASSASSASSSATAAASSATAAASSASAASGYWSNIQSYVAIYCNPPGSSGNPSFTIIIGKREVNIEYHTLTSYCGSLIGRRSAPEFSNTTNVNNVISDPTEQIDTRLDLLLNSIILGALDLLTDPKADPAVRAINVILWTLAAYALIRKASQWFYAGRTARSQDYGQQTLFAIASNQDIKPQAQTETPALNAT